MSVSRIFIFAAVMLAVTVAGSACSSSDSSTPSTNVSPTEPATPSTTPTFTAVYSTVLWPRCAPCHTTAGGIGVTFGKLDMTTQRAAYSNLVGRSAAGIACIGRGTRVTPGQPNASILMLKVGIGDLPPCGAKMPLVGQPLTQSESDLIEAWITAGAMDD